MKTIDMVREMLDKSYRNEVPAGFLERYRNGGPQERVFLPLANGFLRLEYVDDPGILCIASFVPGRDDDWMAIGARLEFTLEREPSAEDEGTFMEYIGVSGLQ